MARIHILGAGTPTPTPTRFGSSYVIEVAEEQLMVDCGPATTHKLVKAGLWPTNIDYLFFTHHHFDHDVDYPCFLLCRWDQSIGKENRLQVYGPNLTEKITQGILGEEGVFTHDWKARVGHPVSQQVYVNRGACYPEGRRTYLPETWGLVKYTQPLTGRLPPRRPITCSPFSTRWRTGWTAWRGASCSRATRRPVSPSLT